MDVNVPIHSVAFVYINVRMYVCLYIGTYVGRLVLFCSVYG